MKVEAILLATGFCTVIAFLGFFFYTIDTNRTAAKLACIEAMKANPAVDCKEIVK